jgi:hypothetical protein
VPFDFQWDNDEKTVIRYRAAGRWNWNDFYKNVSRSLLWLDEVSHPVDVIIDLRGGDKLPAGAVGHLRSIGAKAHTNSTGRAVILGVDDETQKRLGATDGVYQDSQRPLRFVDSDEAAYQVISEWRPRDES